MRLSTFPGQRRRRRSFHRLCHYLAPRAVLRLFNYIFRYTTKRRMYTAAAASASIQIFITFFSIFTFRRNTHTASVPTTRPLGHWHHVRIFSPRCVPTYTVYNNPDNIFSWKLFFNGALGSFALTQHGSLSPVVLYTVGGDCWSVFG